MRPRSPTPPPRGRRFLVAILCLAGAQVACAAAVRCPDVELPAGFDPGNPASVRQEMGKFPPLFFASRTGPPGGLERALAASESPNVCVLGQSLLALATADLADTKVLLAHGADPNALLSSKGGTALAYAIFFGRFASADLLLAHGADPLVVSDEGETPLHALNVPVLAPKSRAHAHALDLGRRLLAAGVPVDARLTETGATPLMQAALRGDEAMVRLLLDHGADPAACSLAGSCVRDLARRSGNRKVVASIDAAIRRKP